MDDPSLDESEPADTGAKEPGLPPKKWYRTPLTLAYLAPPVGFAIWQGSDSGSGQEIGGRLLFVSLFAAPVVHWVHRNGGKGVLALFMQPIFAGIGALIGMDRHEEIPMAVLGYAGWAAIDIGALAYKRERSPAVNVAVAPMAVPHGSGLEVVGAW